MISTVTIFLLIAEILIVVTTPLVLFAIIRFRKLCNFAPFMAGVSALLIIYPIEALVRGFVFAEDAFLSRITGNVLINIILTGVVTIVFGEFVRFIVFRFVIQESNRRHDALAFGAGFALVEVTINTFFAAFEPVMVAGLINESGADAFIATFEDPETGRGVVEVMQSITTSRIIVVTINLLLLIVIQISLAMICFYAVKKKAYRFISLACGLDFILAVPTSLENAGVIVDIAAMIVQVPLVLFTVYVAARCFKDYDKKAVYPDIATFFGIGGRRLGQ